MTVVDVNGHELLEGALIRTVPHSEPGRYLRFRDEEPDEGVFQGRHTGQAVVELEGEENDFPTFASGADDRCTDVEFAGYKLTEEEAAVAFTALAGMPPRTADQAVMWHLGSTTAVVAEYVWDHILGEPDDPDQDQLQAWLEDNIEKIRSAAPGKEES